MRYHAKIFTSYFEYIDPHPEDPRRIYRIYKRLVEAGLVQDSSLSGVDEIGPFMLKIPIREATTEEILEVHSESHLNFIQNTESMSRDQLLEETEKVTPYMSTMTPTYRLNYHVVVPSKHVKRLLKEKLKIHWLLLDHRVIMLSQIHQLGSVYLVMLPLLLRIY